MIRERLRKTGLRVLPVLILTVVCIWALLSTETVYAEETEAAATESNNTGDQSYTTYYSIQPYSYLTETDDGFMRVEYVSGTIAVEYYDSNYNLVSNREVDMELSSFGGFYAGDDAYYLVFGQSNTDEDDSVEVVRVVKYSTEWEREGAACLYGANTYVPFASGSCRMTEYGGYLYIRTSHTMYLSSDGYHHQANLTIQVQESDMTIADSYYSVMNVSYGYVSHSFNQFIMVDDDSNLIALDHGDAYPRAAVLIKYNKQAGESTFHGSAGYVNLLTFRGTTGTNPTGASLGGLEYSSSSYLVAGNSVTQDDDWSSHTARNVFVAVTSRSDFSSSGTEVKWITDYDTDGSVTASTPQLVKTGSDTFLLMWTTAERENFSVTYSKMTKLHYVYLDGEGNTVGDIYTVDGQLSDCQPIVSDGTVTWYVTGDSSSYGSVSTTPVFYTISSNGTFSVHPAIEAPENVSIETASDSIEVNWDAVEGAEGYYVYRAYGSTCSKTTVTDGETTSTTLSATSGKTYYVWVEAYSGSSKSLAQDKQEIMIPDAAAVSEGIELTWGAMNDAESYQIYRKNDDGTYSLVQTTTDTSWTDADVSSGKTCTYKISVRFDDGSSYETCPASAYFLAAPNLISMSNVTSGIQLTWETVEGASKYYINFSSTASGSRYTTATAESGDTQTFTYSYSNFLYSGNTYTFYIRAYNASEAQCSTDSNTLSIYYLEAPSVTVEDGGDSACLTWSEISGAEGYYIYRKTGFGDYEFLRTTTDVSFTDSDVSDSNLYTYQVFAYCGDDLSGGSAEVNWGTADLNDSEISLSETEYIYNGSYIKPAVTVKYGDQTLTQSTHYTISYSNNRKPGTATVTVTGVGSFTGTVTLNFTINKLENTLTASIADDEVVFGDTTTITAEGVGTITYETDNSSVAAVSSEGVVTAVGAGTAVITVHATGSTYYEAGSISLNITVEQRDLSGGSLTLSGDSFVYDGTEKKPVVIVSLDDTFLTEDTDYTVSYSANVNAGTAAVTVTGKENYRGSVSAKFEITKADQTMELSVSATDVAVNETVIIRASASESNFTAVSSDEKIATVVSTGDGEDTFTVTGVSKGTTTITVTASPDTASGSNYNQVSQSFEITVTEGAVAQISLSDCQISLSADSSCGYDGTEQKPAVTIVCENVTLTENEDYTVTYENNVNVGTAMAIVKGAGNYTGLVTKVFTIEKGSQKIGAAVSASEIIVGSTAQITISTERPLTYLSDNNSVASVDSSGKITGLAAGTANITVYADETENYYPASEVLTITVKNAKADQSMTVTAASSSVKVGKMTTLSVSGGIGTITYSSGDTSIATVNSSGKVTAKKKGTVTITVTAAGNSSYNSAAETIEITVTALEKGDTFTGGDVKYKLTSASAVTVTGPSSPSNTKATIPATVKYGGVTYNVTAISSSAFSGKTKLKTVSVGSKVTKIGSKAFYKCTALTSVSGCSAVKTVGSSAFNGCSKLTKVAGLQKATTISSKAFYGCSKLKTVGGTDNKITLAKVTGIGSSAFYNCKAITSVNLTSTALTKIETSAFQNCTALKTFVSKSSKLASIGSKAFYGDKKLASVTLKTSRLTSSNVGSNAFKGIKSTCTFKVPSKNVSAYKKIFKAKGAGSKITVKKV